MADKPIADGSVTIHFREPKWSPSKYDFRDILTHSPVQGGYAIYFETSRMFYPMETIRRVDVQYNSQTYIDRLEAWSSEAHPEHEASDSLDRNCKLCLPIFKMRAELGVEE